MKNIDDRKYCVGCYNDGYNHGLGGANECWSFKTAKLIMRKEVRINDVPPWDKPEHKARKMPSCYHRPKYVYVGPDQLH